MRDQLAEEYKITNSTSYKKISEEEAKNWAATQMSKMEITNHKPVQRELVDPNLTLRPNLEKTLVKNVTTLYHHSGKWEQRRGELFKESVDADGNPFVDVDSEEENLEQENQMNWSCCGNQEENSKGCVKAQKDKHKWIVSSY